MLDTFSQSHQTLGQFKMGKRWIIVQSQSTQDIGNQNAFISLLLFLLFNMSSYDYYHSFTTNPSLFIIVPMTFFVRVCHRLLVIASMFGFCFYFMRLKSHHFRVAQLLWSTAKMNAIFNRSGLWICTFHIATGFAFVLFTFQTKAKNSWRAKKGPHLKWH